jgi:GH24 family phage-related lysozyme (muramidase)
VSVFVNQNEFDALVDFAYNAGAKNLLNSTLLKKLNAGDRKGAAKEFERWVYADGQILGGLVRRRMAERVLFETLP